MSTHKSFTYYVSKYLGIYIKAKINLENKKRKNFSPVAQSSEWIHPKYFDGIQIVI